MLGRQEGTTVTTIDTNTMPGAAYATGLGLLDVVSDTIETSRKAVEAAQLTAQSLDLDTDQHAVLLATVVERHIIELFGTTAVGYLMRERALGRHAPSTALTLTFDEEQSALSMTTATATPATPDTRDTADTGYPGYV